MSGGWNTKYGPRRVRRDLPTLEEAIFAAQGLTSDLQAQAEFAATLLDLPTEEVRARVKKADQKRETVVTSTARDGTRRSVVVERRSRRG